MLAYRPTCLLLFKTRALNDPTVVNMNRTQVRAPICAANVDWHYFAQTHNFIPVVDGQVLIKRIPGAVTRLPDKDGHRTEILCSRCGGHLGHVFTGEHFTPLNTRHCVNSLSLDFVKNTTVEDSQEAIFAAGCFWGVEYYLKQLPGVLKTQVGYTGGRLAHPSYEAICRGNTGHYEAIRVVFDPTQVTYEALTRFFFEIHDPTQTDGQGPDHGHQYLSVIFYYDDEQKNIALSLIDVLRHKGYNLATQVLPVSIFWPAEEYHQDYYAKTHKNPYCHRYIKKF